MKKSLKKSSKKPQKINLAKLNQETLATIDLVAKRLAKKFRFGYHDIDDMEQQARLHALNVIHKWDKTRPLENFLYTCVHNLLFNDKRNKYARPDKPCLDCPLNAYDPHCLKSFSQCTAYDDKEECELYTSWIKRNATKKGLMQPTHPESLEAEKVSGDDDICSEASKRELEELIDQQLPIEYRPDYIKLKHGVKIPYAKHEKLKVVIAAIINGEDLEDINDC